MSALAAAEPGIGKAAAPASAVIETVELSKSFDTRSPWNFIAYQGQTIDDPVGLYGDQAPGVVHICLRRGTSGPCDAHLQAMLLPTASENPFSEIHFLNKAQIVHSHGASGIPLLLVETASLNSINGDQLVLTQVLAYERRSDRFVRVYDHLNRKNNNQEVRYIDSGPLQGDFISVDPTENAPFGFWVSVNAFTPTSAYKEVLRYRSATKYGDGNPLSVVDSEMPNIEQRLGLWRAESPLLLPASDCPKPHMIRMELWCG